MYLKKLELIGFKSFNEKTEFVFNPGVTCIVGPNGCGKSNLLDALRWVLGEQKTSLLRGSKMEEVIFAGTRALKPLGMAEVSLHVDNNDGLLQLPYREISVTRRLFRSGDSEYIMNKQPCRLKDITDLFADTGVGAHAYAIIQQDMIDAILSDRTDDRRFLFEEAAGITKYKHRKKAAERKLDATEQDLMRLKDILSEVTTRVRSLKRQVHKAERYKKISDEIKGWDLYNARERYRELLDRRKEIALGIKSADDRIVGVDSQLDLRFAEMETVRTSLAELDKRLSDLSGKVYELSERAHQLETDISVNREKRENMTVTASRNREEIEALTKRSEMIREEKSGTEEKIAGIEGEVTTASSELEKSLERQKAADSEYIHYKSIADEGNAKLVELEGRLSSGRTDSANLEEQIADFQKEIEHHSERRSALSGEKGRRREEINSIQGQLESSATEIADRETAIARQEKELSDALAEADRLRDLLSETTSTYEATLARKNLLTEMIEQYEGYGSGVVAVFDVADRWVDITGTVADFIHPKSDYRAAIEASLSDSAQYIVSRTQQSAREAVAHLRDKKAGRATFLILERLPETISRPDLPDIAGIIGWADTLVECDERYGRVPLALLGRTVVCENDESAQQTAAALPGGYRAVTSGGDIYANDGLVSGGASEEIPLIGRKDEVTALDNKLHEIDEKISQTRKKHGEATLLIGELRQSLARGREQLDDARDRVAELTSSIKEEQFKINAADEVITSIEQQIENINNKLEKLKHRQYTLSLDFDHLDREKSHRRRRCPVEKRPAAGAGRSGASCRRRSQSHPDA